MLTLRNAVSVGLLLLVAGVAGAQVSSRGDAPPAQLALCAGCHDTPGFAADGEGASVAANLAGQQPGYLRQQLRAFRTGKRQETRMTPVAQALSDSDIDALAAYYSHLPRAPAQSGETLDPTQRPLVFCVRCHGANGVSPNDLWPNLAGQKLDYLRSQMRAYSSGERRDDMMGMWGRMVDEQQLDRILRYFSRQ